MRISEAPNIESIELDGIVSIEAIQEGPTWGLDRIDQNIKPLSNTYSYTSTGIGVTAYVIDTGIQRSHPDLIGAVHNLINAGVTVVVAAGNSTAISAGVSSALLANATSGVITGTPTSTANLLIYANPSN